MLQHLQRAMRKGDFEGDFEGEGRAFLKKKTTDKTLMAIYEEAMMEQPRDILEWNISGKKQKELRDASLIVQQGKLASDNTFSLSDLGKRQVSKQRSPDILWIGEHPVLRLFSTAEEATVQLPLTHIQGAENIGQIEVVIQTSQATKKPNRRTDRTEIGIGLYHH